MDKMNRREFLAGAATLAAVAGCRSSSVGISATSDNRGNVYDADKIRFNADGEFRFLHLTDVHLKSCEGRLPEETDALLRQDDITLIEKKDYIKNPKPNGLGFFYCKENDLAFARSKRGGLEFMLRKIVCVCVGFGSQIIHDHFHCHERFQCHMFLIHNGSRHPCYER